VESGTLVDNMIVDITSEWRTESIAEVLDGCKSLKGGNGDQEGSVGQIIKEPLHSIRNAYYLS
jgi:hypothetical protein